DRPEGEAPVRLERRDLVVCGDAPPAPAADTLPVDCAGSAPRDERDVENARSPAGTVEAIGDEREDISHGPGDLDLLLRRRHGLSPPRVVPREPRDHTPLTSPGSNHRRGSNSSSG